MKKLGILFALCLAIIFSGDSFAATSTFNQHGEYHMNQNYLILSGGIFANGQTRDGANTNGQGWTIYRVWDDNNWETGSYAGKMNTWVKDGWFYDTAGTALRMDYQGASQFDNNGIAAGTMPANFYNYDYFTGASTPGGHGAYWMYSMSRNYDHVYAGYFKIEDEITVDQIKGYFTYKPSYNVLLDDPRTLFRMNIWSSDGAVPTNTGSFIGDVFSSELTAGIFSYADTGVNRIATAVGVNDDIYELTYTLDTPITLQPGEYWFSHDAQTVPVPAAVWLLGSGLAGLLALRRKMSG